MGILTKFYKKLPVILFLMFIVIMSFFIDNARDKAYAQEQIMSCPISKRVPIGSTIDQMTYSIDAFVANTQSIIDHAAMAYRSAGALINAVNTGCKPANCQSSCNQHTEWELCDPSCVGVTCDLCPVSVCDTLNCGGEACPFSLISQLVNAISADKTAIVNANIKIHDFFNKKVLEFPIPSGDSSLFGKFCDNELFSMPVCLTSCKATEYHALECLVIKSINNIALCDIIKPNDILSGRKGETLWRCKDIEPPPVPNCVPDLYNDFFCCSMEL
jgi:hypothetical protein